jgi:hypothetical protein
MESKNKTHFRKVFKSDHLGSADVEEYIEEGKSLIFTIFQVTQHAIDPKIKASGVVVAGKRISANIAYFKEPNTKPLVLNATNSRILKNMVNSPFVEDWKGLRIEVYIDKDVKMKGEVVGGVRIKSKPFKPMTEQDLKVLTGKLAALTTRAELTELFRSNTQYKISKEAGKLFTNRGIEMES